MRISINQLRMLCDQINEATNSPKTPYSEVDGKHQANIGNYHLSQAYGGVSLHRMYNDGGGVTTPLGGYHMPKRELYNKMVAFLAGIETARKE